MPAQQKHISQLYQYVRATSESLCSPLEIEDYGIQTMVDVSPPKWHLAHVSWFFESFILKPYLKSYQEFNGLFAQLFNSYYETAGRAHPRPQRGLLSRPTVKEIYQYRQHVDLAMHQLLDQHGHEHYGEILERCLLGCHHEQQHQELLLTDIKHIFAYNPLKPAYQSCTLPADKQAPPLQWYDIKGGMVNIGHNGEGFCFDNELPQHPYYIADFKIANRLITNAEYCQFIDDGGYQQVDLWLSDGWQTIKQQSWQAPLYWEKHEDEWFSMGLNGLQALNPHQPVCHVSYYEADAFARWSNKRLLTEFEWEWAARDNQGPKNFQEQGWYEPNTASTQGIQQMLGDVWEWTQSAYLPYLGFQALPGTLGEYNGKFMANQMVLRGGSCITPELHMRNSYRNFFYAKDRWQFSGIRLAYTS